jgi:dihydrofolate reductase
VSKLVVFNNVSLDGYFVDMNGDMSWAHSDDPEWSAFTKENAQGDAVFVFGRITYELMSTYWPTPYALKSNPDVAERMNAQRKIVFSRTLDEATWNNTTLAKGDIAAKMRKLKDESGPDLLIFGSGTIVSQLTQHALIDEYRLVVKPIVLGSGRTMFEGVDTKLSLKLTDTRAFRNGNVLLCYEPTT